MIETASPAVSVRRAEDQALTRAKTRTHLRVITFAGTLTVLGYICYFVLMQSHALWGAPTLLQDRWKGIFYPFVALFPPDWVRPPWDSPFRPLTIALYLLLVAAMFAVYVWAVRRTFRVGSLRAEEAGGALRRILAITAIALCVLVVVPGVLSTDLFSYVWYGRMFAIFGDSPFTHVPTDYAWRDTGNWLQWVFWKETPSAYGPAWVLLAGLVAQVGQAFNGDIAYNILGNKILTDLGHIANVFLIWKVAGLTISRYWHRPHSLPADVSLLDWQTGMQAGVTLAYAWNPLIMIEGGANGHNDILMVTGILAALWLYLLGHWRLGAVALAAAALVKFNAVLFVPGYLWLLLWAGEDARWKMDDGRWLKYRPTSIFHRLWNATQATLLMLATFALFYLPFWDGPAALKPLVSGPYTEQYVNSLGYMVRFKLPEGAHHLASMFGWQPTDFWTTNAIGQRLDWPVRWGSVLLLAVFAVMQTWRARTFPRMLSAWGWVAFVYLTLAAVWFWPWYVIWLVPVAALVGPGRLLNATLILSLSSLALYAAVWRSNSTFMEWANYKPLIMLGPPLIYAIVSWLLDARRRAQAARTLTTPSARHQIQRELVPAQVRTEAHEQR